MAEEIDNPTRYIEGATKKVSVNVYERNPMARKKCLERYGFSCVICGCDFEKIFGELGKGFIHVHHIIELNQIGKEYEIDPINDLRPVCPNCHAMLHKKKPAFTVEELKDIINDNR
ncbi:HNH endonuclease [Bacillus subtilis]